MSSGQFCSNCHYGRYAKRTYSDLVKGEVYKLSPKQRAQLKFNYGEYCEEQREFLDRFRRIKDVDNIYLMYIKDKDPRDLYEIAPYYGVPEALTIMFRTPPNTKYWERLIIPELTRMAKENDQVVEVTRDPNGGIREIYVKPPTSVLAQDPRWWFNEDKTKGRQ